MKSEDNEIVVLATEKTYANLIADIVGYPDSEPTLAYLECLNPSLIESEIRDRLQFLREVGVLSQLEDGDNLTYTLTKQARYLFDEQGIFPESAWQRQYQRVTVESEDRGS